MRIAADGPRYNYIRTAASLKALGIEKWKLLREREKPKQIQLTGGALEALMRLGPVCRALGLCVEPRRERADRD
ncbi:MAG: hypothetical protein ACP5MH_05275 [Thermoproteus sp.]